MKSDSPKFRILSSSLAGFFAFAVFALAGSLTPPGAPSPTMNTLAELYDSIVGGFDSTGVVADQNGSLIEHLKYIEANMPAGSGWTDDGTVVRLTTSTDHVGIGTTTPTAVVQVVSTDAGPGLRLLQLHKPDLGAGDDVFLKLGKAQSFMDEADISYRHAADGSTSNALAFGFNGISPVMLIEGTGNVGIGTLTPNNKLQVAGLISFDDTGFNTALGSGALSVNTGFVNTAVGYQSLQNNTTGDDNTAVGYQSLQNNTTGGENTAVGLLALFSNTTGVGNTANGFVALEDNTTGDYNTANGYEALGSNTTGDDNTAIGQAALGFNTTGGGNTAIGEGALALNTTGSNNVAVGAGAGSGAPGSGNVFLGYSAGGLEIGSNRLYIDNSNTTTPLIYGEFDNDYLQFGGRASIAGTFGPTVTNTYDLGSPTLKWRNLYVQNFSSGSSMSGNFDPSADNTYDLGEPALRWRALYLGPGSLHISSTTGTSGAGTDYTDGKLAFSGASLSFTSLPVGAGASGSIELRVGNSTTPSFLKNIYLSSSGNVGMGTNAPDEALVVYERAVFNGQSVLKLTGDPTATSRFNSAFIAQRGAAAKDVAGLAIGEAGQAWGTSDYFLGMQYQGGSVDRNFYIARSGYTSFLNGTPFLTILNTNGKIGINNTAPTTAFDIKGSSTFDPFNVASVSGTSLFYITKGGNIGVGTTTPIEQFHVPGKVPAGTAGSLTLNHTSAFSTYVQGRYAYIGAVGGGVQIVDISDPTAPASRSQLSISGIRAVYVQGNYLYTAQGFGDNRLGIYDVSNIMAPTLVGFIANADQRYVVVEGRYAYTLDTSGALHVYDVANPAAPTQTGTVTTGAAAGNTGMYVSGKYVYTMDATSGRLRIFNVANPAAPYQVSSTVVTGTGPGIYVQGRYAYVTTSTPALRIFDISNPNTPTQVGSVTTQAGPEQVFVQGRYAYVANFTAATLQFFDVSNPAAPVSIGSVPTSPSVYALYVQGRYAYVTNFNAVAKLETFDLGGSYIQQFETGGMETGTLMTRNNAFVGNDMDIRGGLVVARGANITGPFSVTSSVSGYNAFTVNPDGSASVSGTLETGGLVINGHLRPGATDTYDLGSSTLRWRDLYLASGSLHIGVSGDEAVVDYDVASDYLAFKPDGSSTRFAILDAGNVGIGTTAPTQRLHVSGAAGARIALDRVDGGAEALIVHNTSGYMSFRNTADSADVPIQTSSIRSTSQGTLVGLDFGPVSASIRTNSAVTPVITFNTGGASLSGNFDPSADTTYDLGKTNLRWRDLYLASGSLHIGVSGDEAVVDYDVTSDYLAFKPDGSTTRMAILDGGNVGIGTTAPVAPLTINRGLSSFGVLTGVTSAGTLSSTRVATSSTPAASTILQTVWDFPAGGGGIFNALFSAQTASTSAQNMTGQIFALAGYSEHLGTGTATTVTGLQGQAINRSTGTVTTAKGIQAFASNLGGGTVTTGIGVYSQPSLSGGGTMSNMYGILAGRAPILTGTLSNHAGLAVEHLTQATNNIELLIASTSAGLNIPAGNFGIYNASPYNNYFAGNVGIGTTNAGQKLEVSGTASVSGNVFMTGLSATAAGDDYVCRDPVTGEIRFGATCTPSSIRFKKNVEDLSHGLDWVRELRPVTFDWKHNGEPSLGFIAEEVNEVSPLLALRQDGKIFSVNYQLMTSVLAKAIQELDLKVETLAADGPMTFDEEGMFDRFVALLADVVLRVRGLTADEVRTDKICVGDTCVTEEQFQAVFGASAPEPTPTPEVSDEPSPTPDSTVTPEPSVTPTPESSVEPTPTPEENGSLDEPLEESAPQGPTPDTLQPTPSP